MTTVTVEFKVAMDEEQRKAKNIHNVKFECSFDGADMDMVKRLAIQQQVVRWQQQIRANWNKFLSDGLPSTIAFGVPLYEGKRSGATPMTAERAEEFLLNQDRLTQVRTAITLMEKVGMEVSVELLEEESLLIEAQNSEVEVEQEDVEDTI